jgi:hypothetical protein
MITTDARAMKKINNIFFKKVNKNLLTSDFFFTLFLDEGRTCIDCGGRIDCDGCIGCGCSVGAILRRCLCV